MSIERTVINNGDINELYNKLLTYVSQTPADGKFFKSVTISNNMITCTDWDDDVVFNVSRNNSSSWTYCAPTYSSNAYSTWSTVKNMPSSPMSSHPVAVYTVGKSAFCIELAYGAENNHIALVVIGKDTNGNIASFYPLLNMVNAGNIPETYSVYSKGIDIPNQYYVGNITIKQSSAYKGVPTGSLTCIVKAATIGSISGCIDMSTVYVSRCLESGIYGKTRIVNGTDQGRFLTNGLVFVKDDDED